MPTICQRTFKCLLILLSSGIVLFSSGVTSGFARETAVIRFPTGVTYQDAYIKASNTEAQDHFGAAVAVSGDTLVVGSPQEDSATTGVNGNQSDNSAADSGAVYVFIRAGDGWVQQAYLKASNAEAGDYFGESVAIAGDTIVVGAYGEDSAALGVNGNPSDNSAASSGAAYIFTRSNGVWSQQAYLKASNSEASDCFGGAVTIAGHTVIVGAHGEDSTATGVNGNESDNSASYSGAAYVFTYDGGAWSQQAYLKASNSGANDQFGTSLAVSGDTMVVGAYKEDSSAIGVNGNQADNSAVDSGAAYIFIREGGVWNQQAYLKASNTGTDDFFGYSVGISGDMVVVGAPKEDGWSNSLPYAGAAYLFNRSNGVWDEEEYNSPGKAYMMFGHSVAISGDEILVGAYGDNSSATGVGGNPDLTDMATSGAAYLITHTHDAWTGSRSVYLKASNTGAVDRFGMKVAMSEKLQVVSAEFEDSSGTGVNGDQSDNSAADSGAVYVFRTLPKQAMLPMILR